MFIKCSLNEVSSRSRFTLIKLILSVCLLQLCLAVQISGPHNKTKIKKVKKNVYVNETDLTRKMRIFTGEVNGSIFKNAVFPLKGEIDSNETPGYSDQDIEGPPPKRNPLNRIRGCFMGN